MRRTFAVLMVCAVLTAASARAQSRAPAPPQQPVPITTIADTVPPPPGAPNLAWLSALEVDMGATPPADSSRRAFMAAFRGAFAEGAYATERDVNGEPAASLPLSARFRLIEGTGGWGAWGVHVVLRLKTAQDICAHPDLDPFAASVISVTVESRTPKAEEAGQPVVPVTTWLRLGGGVTCDPKHEPIAGQRDLTMGWWRELGRATGLLALERLHRLSGDLDADTRFALGPAERVSAAEAAAPDPAPKPARPAPRRR